MINIYTHTTSVSFGHTALRHIYSCAGLRYVKSFWCSPETIPGRRERKIQSKGLNHTISEGTYTGAFSCIESVTLEVTEVSCYEEPPPPIADASSLNALQGQWVPDGSWTSNLYALTHCSLCTEAWQRCFGTTGESELRVLALSKTWLPRWL